MDRFFKTLNKFRLKLNISFIASALVSLIFSVICSLLKYNQLETVNIIKTNLIFIIDVIFVFILCFISKSNKSYSYLKLFVFIICDLICFYYTNTHFSIALSLLLTGLSNIIIDKFDCYKGVLLLIVFSTLFTFSIVYVNPILIYYLKIFSVFISDKPTLFSIINNFYKLFISDNLEYFIFDTGIGLTKVVNNQMITGIKQIFIFDTINKDVVVSKFLSNEYIMSIFVSIGIFLLLFNKVDKPSKISLTIITVSTIISGNTLILSLYLIMLNPISYIAYLMLTGLSNLIVSLVDIRIGYVTYPSIIELIKYIEKPSYFMIIGIVFIALSYFLFELVFDKYSYEKDFVLDRNARRIINALGGLNNVLKLEDDVLVVKNPNLINIIKLDCEIYNNKVVLLDDDLIVLKEYL